MSENHHVTIEQEYRWLDFDGLRRGIENLMDLQKFRFPDCKEKDCGNVGKLVPGECSFHPVRKIDSREE